MISEKDKKNFTYIRIVKELRNLHSRGIISEKEYERGKDYYAKLIGADLLLEQ